MKHWLKKPPQHPLRNKLSDADWARIQSVMTGTAADVDATIDELEAAHDVLFDAVAAHQQTHLGILSLQ